MVEKQSYRIEPYPEAAEVKQHARSLIIAVIFVFPLFVFTLLQNDICGWIPSIILLIFLLGGFVLKSARGVGCFDFISAYKNQNDFHKLSSIAYAKVLDKKQAHGFWLTILFTANTPSKGVYEQRLTANISQTLYQNAGETIAVRYSTLNPRIAALEGEEGFYRKHPPVRSRIRLS